MVPPLREDQQRLERMQQLGKLGVAAVVRVTQQVLDTLGGKVLNLSMSYCRSPLSLCNPQHGAAVVAEAEVELPVVVMGVTVSLVQEVGVVVVSLYREMVVMVGTGVSEVAAEGPVQLLAQVKAERVASVAAVVVAQLVALVVTA